MAATMGLGVKFLMLEEFKEGQKKNRRLASLVGVWKMTDMTQDL